MLRTTCNVLSVATLAGFAAGCATEPPHAITANRNGGTGAYRVGVPYQIGDNWYYPHEQPDYDETGIASWYGPTFYGKPTADGEIYDGEGLTAAHRTLPLPVSVRVTNLENGKSLVLRVNDRGPFASGRIIDVSKHAAELLGFYAKGTAKVRVTYLGRADLPNRIPSDELGTALASNVRVAPTAKIQTAALSSSKPRATAKPARIATITPPPRLSTAESSASDDRAEPTDADDRAVEVPNTTHLYVQAGAFGSRENAERLKENLGSAGDLFVSASERQGRELYRVRSGPYDDLETANAALARLSDLGNNDARIVVDQ
jgi:rare lipoprotein A